MRALLFLLLPLLVCGKLVHIKSEEEYKTILKSSKPVFLFFTLGRMCSPCTQLAPIIEAEANSNQDVVFASIDIEGGISAKVVNSFGMRGLPTSYIFKNGTYVKEHGGQFTKQELKDFVASACG